MLSVAIVRYAARARSFKYSGNIATKKLLALIGPSSGMFQSRSALLDLRFEGSLFVLSLLNGKLYRALG